MRLTEAEARRLGLKLPETARKSKTASGAKPSSKEGQPKRSTRQAVQPYPGEAVTIRIPLQHDPRPKERPRTVVNFDFLKSAFLSASGNLSKFLSIINSRRENGNRLMVTYTPEGTRAYEGMIKSHVAAAFVGREAYECPVRVDLIFILQDEHGRWPVSQADGDADNLEKAVLDGLNHSAFTDDRLVVVSSRRKVTGPEPAILIHIAPAQPCDFLLSFEPDTP